MPKNKRLHYKDINALRAIAAIPIYLFCILFIISGTEASVLTEITSITGNIAQSSFDFFFFLTAFLLTSLGLREYKYTDQFSLKNFFIRRVLRLLVVLIFAMVFIFLLHPWLIKVLQLRGITKPDFEPFLFLVPNYLSDFGNGQLLYLKVISTVFMFFQFYVVWAFVLRFFHKFIPIIGVILIIIGSLTRVLHLAADSSYLLDTLAHGTTIGIGAIVAYAMRSDLKFVERLKNFSKNMNSLVYVIGVSTYITGYLFLGSSYASVLLPLILASFFGYIIIEQTFGKNSFVQFKTKKILTYIGKISYGMIIYQAIVGVLLMIAVESLDFDLTSFYVIGLIIIFGFIGSIVVADISYKLFEKPLLRIRREFKKV